jgi:hypothetical protein
MLKGGYKYLLYPNKYSFKGEWGWTTLYFQYSMAPLTCSKHGIPGLLNKKNFLSDCAFDFFVIFLGNKFL